MALQAPGPPVCSLTGFGCIWPQHSPFFAHSGSFTSDRNPLFVLLSLPHPIMLHFPLIELLISRFRLFQTLPLQPSPVNPVSPDCILSSPPPFLTLIPFSSSFPSQFSHGTHRAPLTVKLSAGCSLCSLAPVFSALRAVTAPEECPSPAEKIQCSTSKKKSNTGFCANLSCKADKLWLKCLCSRFIGEFHL